MRVFGYARASTSNQTNSVESQTQRLLNAGVRSDRLFSELISGKNKSDREQLNLCLLKMEQGDKLIVCKIDRLARSTLDLLAIVEELKNRGIAIEFLDEKIDTSTATGELLLTLLGSIAQLERKTILERTARGRIEAKEKGVKFGRPKKDIPSEAIKADKQAGLSITFLAKKYKLSRQTVYNILS